MIRLIGVELRRLLHRRLTLVAGLALLAAVGLFQLAVNSAVAPPSPAAITQNQRYLEEAQRDWDANHEKWEQECAGGQEDIPAECVTPRPTPAEYGLAATPFADIALVGMQLATFVTMLAAYLVAASAIGAEYTSGSLANWLSFVPSRGKVYASKLVAVVLVAGVGSALIVGLMFALTALITSLYGGGLEGAGDVTATGARGLVLAVLAAAFGFAFGLLTRHTGAALGLVLGYLVLSVVVGIATVAVPVLGFLPPWLPEYNLAAFLEYGTTYSRAIEETTASGVEYRTVEERISFAHSAGYWAVLAAVAVVVSTAVFRRRDIT